MRPDVGPLFEPLEVNGHTIPNRIVMPPMATNRGITSDQGLHWYAEHAAGGVGMLIVEAVPVDRFGKDIQMEGLRALANAIRGHGPLAVMQLFPAKFGRDPRPGDLEPVEIQGILSGYEAAARMCAEAGFDGVEPHGAHGFLLNQFFSPAENARQDRYGGSLENRMNMGLDVVRAARRGAGPQKLLLYRHTPAKENSYGLEESLRFAERLVEEGVDVLDISPASAEAPADMAEPFRQFGAPVIGVGLMDEVERAVEALTRSRADLIAVGRGLIADPLWPRKVQEGRFEEIVSCTRCDEKCFGNLREGLAIECTQW
ncbi:MAG: oxidoreductase [Planctomycetota bacterium]|jgi:2,4-dienoyl-CoA reductase-like NADH-dependent reductase (Old Yellow Enzyme family)